jgi:3-oxoacyl-[acyl-carrier protein] reductase
MDLGLKGARVLVTGSTKGIGRAIAETFAAEGASVGICSRNQADVDSAVAALKARGVVAHGGAVDVSNGAALKDWVSDMASKLGGVDVVVANVSALSIGQDEESWEKEFSTDMMGTVRLVNAAMPYLEKSGAGAIVTISSVSGREVDFASGPYGTFKAAIIHYTQGLAYQLASKGIRANSVSPGNTYFEGGVWNMIKDNNPELYNTALALNPTGHGHSAGDGERCRISSEPRREFHHRNEPCRGRRLDTRCPVLGVGSVRVILTLDTGASGAGVRQLWKSMRDSSRQRGGETMPLSPSAAWKHFRRE